MSKKQLTILIIVIVCVVVAGGMFWYVKQNKQKPVNSPVTDNEKEQNNTSDSSSIASTTEEIATLTTEQVDTSNWETYRNEEYGFEVKYPEDYIIKKIEGGIYLKHPSVDLVPIHPPKGGAVSIALTKTKIEDEIKSIEKSDPPFTRVRSQKEYILDDVKGTEIVGTVAEGLDFYEIFIKYNNKEYLIDYGDIGLDYSKEILSTFKFIK